MASVADLLGALELEFVSEHRYRAVNVDTGTPVVFGGQLMSQAIAAAQLDQPEKSPKSLHTIFTRGGEVAEALDVEVERMHAGRAFGSVAVSFSQAERLIARSLVLVHAEEPDLIRHARPAPVVDGPDDLASLHAELEGWDIRIVDGVDVDDADAVGPAELFVWIRFECPAGEAWKSAALLAYATDGFLIGTSMRPHKGIGQAMAHHDFSTGVITHTLSFHEPVDAAGWLLMANECPYAGRGRIFGTADVFDTDGRLVASFMQESMVRHFPDGQRGGL